MRHEQFGELWLARAWLAVIFALIALSLQAWTRRWRVPRQLLLVAAGLGMLLTSTDSGHASVSGPLAFVADGVHITAAAIWLGGLAFLLGAIALSRSDQRWPLAAVSVPRFSLLATITVPLLGAAGIVSAYSQVGAWRGLWQTTYGVLILAKIGLVLPLLALGAFNNRVSVPALRSGAAVPGDPRALHPGRRDRARAARRGTRRHRGAGRRGAREERADAAPRGARAGSRFHGDALGRALQGAWSRFGLRRSGPNTVEMTVTSGSRHLPIGEVDLAAVPPLAGAKALKLNVVQLSSTRFRTAGAALRRPGRWELEMTIRTGLTEWLARIPVTIAARPR